MWTTRLSVVFALSMVLIASPLNANTADDIKRAGADGDYGTVLRLAMPYAQKGNPMGAYFVGAAYEMQGKYSQAIKWLTSSADSAADESWQWARHAQWHLYLILKENHPGLPQNPSEANRRLRQAAENGLPMAQHNYASYLWQDEGELERARAWYEKAANSGQVESKVNLAIFLLQGKGGSRDTDTGIRLLQHASESGVAVAQFMLGQVYQEGIATVQNYVLAHAWYSLASALGDRRAREARNRLAAQMSLAQLEQAQQEAAGWSEHLRAWREKEQPTGIRAPQREDD